MSGPRHILIDKVLASIPMLVSSTYIRVAKNKRKNKVVKLCSGIENLMVNGVESLF